MYISYTIYNIVYEMAGYGRYIFMHSGNLLGTRSCMTSLYQNASKDALKSLKKCIFPPKPKRPQSSFLLYAKHVRSKFIHEQPGIKPLEVIKKASREWAELDPSEKELFQKEYNDNYKMYIEQLKEYNNSITNEQKQLWEEKQEEYKESHIQGDSKKKKQSFDKPKKPVSAFLLYASSKKSERDPNTPFTKWMKSLTGVWNQLSDVEKEPYVTQATQLMIRYRQDLSEWETKMIQLGHFDIVRRKTLVKHKSAKSEQ